jgi:hypothetical protein
MAFMMFSYTCPRQIKEKRQKGTRASVEVASDTIFALAALAGGGMPREGIC